MPVLCLLLASQTGYFAEGRPGIGVTAGDNSTVASFNILIGISQ